MDGDWVSALTPSFFATHFARLPYGRPAGAAAAAPLLDWATFDRVLPAAADVLTVAAGRLVDAPAPRSAADVRRLMRDGVSTVVRGSERHDVALAALAARFGAAVPGEVHVQLYATPARTHSYGWHYDFEDVFIAQTMGAKDYLFRPNTVARDTRLGEVLDFTVIRQERSQTLGSRLLVGDCLYIPRRWWHLVRCIEDSLSISVGVMPEAAIRDAVRIPPGWSPNTGSAVSS
jgi:50S ribosomal protein L16 3-hydroxylase